MNNINNLNLPVSLFVLLLVINVGQPGSELVLGRKIYQQSRLTFSLFRWMLIKGGTEKKTVENIKLVISHPFFCFRVSQQENILFSVETFPNEVTGGKNQ